MPRQKINLLNLDQVSLRDFFSDMGEKPFRAEQLLRWLHFYGVTDFDQMTNFSYDLRAYLYNNTVIELPIIVQRQQAKDGTIKWLLKVSGGNCIETVFIPETSRGTLCISSQVGCMLDCHFCSTGKQGFNRNLSTAEIIGQVWLAVRELSCLQGSHDRRITNIVLMGMGEPLLNFDAVLSAINIMLSDHAYSFAKRRVTLSTAGVVPAMQRLMALSDVSLAVSLHAPNDALRDQLVPLNKKYPLQQLMAVCKNYFTQESRRKITFEYVMLADVNDHMLHAKQLAKLLDGIPAKVNLIPFNAFPRAPYQCSSPEVIQQFHDLLVQRGVNTIVRKTRGDDIAAACGQLAGKVLDRTKRAARWQQRLTERATEVA